MTTKMKKVPAKIWHKETTNSSEWLSVFTLGLSTDKYEVHLTCGECGLSSTVECDQYQDWVVCKACHTVNTKT